MNKLFKSFLFLVFTFITLISVSACSVKTEKVDNVVKTKRDMIVSDDVSYVEDNSEVLIKRNKLTKKSAIHMTYSISENEEYDDFLGERVTMMPMLFNMTCSMLTMSIFDPEGLEKMFEDGVFQKSETPKDETMKNYLDGYTTEKISIKFIDAENQEEIAYCESTEAGNENIKVKVSRDYSDVKSLFGVEIGKFNK